jgi:hypothetical protein
MKACVRKCIVVVTLGPFATASDWYVDAVAGNNANSGVSPSQAWRTITFAASQVPTSGIQRIVVAPGTYDAMLGESWPLAMRDGLQIVGEGPSSTTLAGGSWGVFQFDASSGASFGPSTLVRGLHLVGPGNGPSGNGVAISVHASYGAATPTLTNLVIERWSYGVASTVWLSGHSSPTLESVEVHDCFTGLWVLGASHLLASDSSFHDNLGSGVAIGGAHGTPQPTFRRCRIDRNGASGVAASAGDYDANGVFEDCSISFNALHGWSSPASFTISGRNAYFLRSTIAFNGGKAIYGPDVFGYCGQLGLSQSILWGHAVDLDYQGTVTATRNDIGDGSFNGVNGNFSADPSFANGPAGDLRLRWGSPCVDASTVAPPAGSLDLLREDRVVDGDLQATETADLGAFEFRPLEVLGPQTIGSLLQWELRGPAGAATTLYWSRQPLAAAPTATPFGQLDLVPGQTSPFRVTTIGPGSSTTLQRLIPGFATLVGRTFSFQALTSNPLAPNGKAYTNAVQVTILP